MSDFKTLVDSQDRPLNGEPRLHEAVPPFPQRYRINALRLLVAFAVTLFAVTASPPAIPFFTFLVATGGQAAIVLAIVGRAWTLLYIGERKNAEVVMTGPYSITRNPLYLFSLIGIAGIGAQTGSMLLIVLFTACAYAVFTIAIRGEERYLDNRFGLQFREYFEVTPRLIPDPALWRESDCTKLRSKNAVAGLKDGMVFAAAWAGIELIKAGHANGAFPLLMTLPI